MISDIPLPTLPGPFGPIRSVSSFTVFLVLAFAIAFYLAPKELRRRNLAVPVADHVILLSIIGGMFGAKLGYVFEIWHSIWIVVDSPLQTVWYLIRYYDGMAKLVPGAFGFWQTLLSGGGLVFYGGFIVAVGLVSVYFKRQRLSFVVYGDVFAMMIALGYGIGRLGCMVSGDGCFGYKASLHLPWLTMVYGPKSVIPSAGVRVWNTPLIEALLSLLLFSWYWLKARFIRFRPGFFISLFLIYDGLCRFLIEFLRINDAIIPVLDHPAIGGQPLLHHNDALPDALYFTHWHWYGFTQSQIVGGFLFVMGMIWMIRSKLYRKETDADTKL